VNVVGVGGGYPAVFAMLPGRALARCHVALAAYLRGLASVLVCGAN
jgi:hypothetical protein